MSKAPEIVRMARLVGSDEWMHLQSVGHTMSMGYCESTAYRRADLPPKVKPLVWTSKGYAQTPFGKYQVIRENWTGDDDFWFICFAGKPYGPGGEHPDEASAKAAAQANYERRILIALDMGEDA